MCEISVHKNEKYVKFSSEHPDRRYFCVTRRDNHALFLSLFIGASYRKGESEGGWQSRVVLRLRVDTLLSTYIHAYKAATCRDICHWASALKGY